MCPHLHVCDQNPLEAKRGNCLHTDRKRTLKRSPKPNQALKRAKAQKPMDKGTPNPRGSPELTAAQLAIGRELPRVVRCIYRQTPICQGSGQEGVRFRVLDSGFLFLSSTGHIAATINNESIKDSTMMLSSRG